jgi:DedD protein
MPMDERLKERLVGATVLVFLAVIFVPMILDNSPKPEDGYVATRIPAKPAGGFSSSVVPLEPADDERRRDSGDPSVTPAPGGAVSGEPRSAFEPPPPGPGAKLTPRSRQPETAAKKPLRPPVTTRAPADASSNERSGLTAWAIQLGSFSNQGNAAALKKRLLEMGFDAFVEPVSTEKGTVTRVFIGPVLERAEAEAQLKGKKLESLQKEMKLKALLRRYPSG